MGGEKASFGELEDKLEHKIHFLAPKPGALFHCSNPLGCTDTDLWRAGGAIDRNYFKAKLDTRASETVDVTIENLGWTATGLSVSCQCQEHGRRAFHWLPA